MAVTEHMSKNLFATLKPESLGVGHAPVFSLIRAHFTPDNQ